MGLPWHMLNMQTSCGPSNGQYLCRFLIMDGQDTTKTMSVTTAFTTWPNGVSSCAAEGDFLSTPSKQRYAVGVAYLYPHMAKARIFLLSRNGEYRQTAEQISPRYLLRTSACFAFQWVSPPPNRSDCNTVRPQEAFIGPGITNNFALHTK